MDQANTELRDVVGRLVFLGQNDLAGHYAGVVQHLEKLRADFYREAQGGIVLPGPGGLLKG